ncbi:hypothetical protein FNF31_05415 [Cafeteria roenbergensis]|uniref:CSC1/OSCA1-like cytosolic domain-containing protein n=1 Tax=Cafeteria roenbergensis TaxID=33653 RepID=A0A5A8D141_CAFRO|nr:hypothetical protein FNF31_05415 [Cafeteria roenbergensis]KAA0160004.1 hypothetical protein FNF28_05584 [Cafeteria roenbergensis]
MAASVAPPARLRKDGSSGRGDLTEFDVFLKDAPNPHLSWQRVVEHRDRTHPRRFVTGDDGSVHHEQLNSCTMNVGCHKACPSMCRNKSDDGDLITFGIGVSLFFKFAKFVIVLMLVLTLLLAPSLVIYAIGDTDWRAGGTAADATQLWRFTPANIGSSSGICDSAYAGEGDSLKLRCPSGTVMTAVTAAFGLNVGECSCPAARIPDESDQCPDQRRSDGTCAPGEVCQFSSERPIELKAGLAITTGACCATKLTNGIADFSDINFREEEDCSAASANRLVEAMCLRQQECEISANEDTLHVWQAPSSVDGTTFAAWRTCNGTEAEMGAEAARQYRSSPSSVVVAPGVDMSQASQVCAQRFSSQGGLDTATCSNPSQSEDITTSFTYQNELLSGNRSASSSHVRLMAIATCTSLYVEVPGYLHIPKDDVARIVMVCDILMIIGFLIAISILSRREADEAENVSFASPADYTVVIRDLPPHTDVRQLDKALREHLRTHLNRSLPVVKDNAKLADHGCSVADINFGLDSEILTELKVEHGEAAANIQRLVAEMKARGISWKEIQATRDYKLLMEQGGGCAVRFCGGRCLSCCGSEILQLAYHVEQGKAWLRAASAEVDQVRERDRTTKAVYAFVTFVEEEAAFRARAEFPNSTCYSRLCLPAEARLPYKDPESGDDKLWPLKVQRADEPSDIIWENMRFAKSTDGAIRRFCATFLTLLVLVLAFGAIYVLERQRVLADRQYPETDCSVFANPNDKVAALLDEKFEAFGEPTGKTGRMQCYCTNLLLNASGNPLALFEEQFPVPESYEVASATRDSILGSDAAATQRGSAGSGLSITSMPSGWHLEQLCGRWVETYVQVQLLTYGSAVIVLVVKAMVIAFIRLVVRHEKLTSKTQQTLSRASKMFVSQFIITAMLVVLINARINEPGLSSLFIGEHADFTAAWYKGPGTSIMLTMLLNVFFDAFTPMRRVAVRWFAQCRDRGCTLRATSAKTGHRRITKVATQAELNELYSGILMPMDEMYASIVNQIFVCITFATGMPLLVPVAAVFAMVFFSMHRCLFVNSYRTPASTSEILSKKMTAFLPAAAVLHAFLGAWMLSNPEVFPATTEIEAATAASGQAEIDQAINSIGEASQAFLDSLRSLTFSGYNIGNRLAKAHVFPLFAVGIILLALFIVRYTIGRAVYKLGKSVCTACRCCCSCFLKAENAGFEDLKPYFDALPDAVLQDFPRKYHPKPALTAAYRLAKIRRRENATVKLRAARVVETKLAALRAARKSLEATHAHVAALAARIESDNQSSAPVPEATRAALVKQLEEATQKLERESQIVKAAQEEASQAHSRARRMRAREMLARRLSRVTSKDEETRIRGQLGAAAGAGDPTGTPVAPDSTASKVISSTMVHSYDVDDNAAYMTSFGFHVMRSFADPDLLREIHSVMPVPHGAREARRSRRVLERRVESAASPPSAPATATDVVVPPLEPSAVVPPLDMVAEAADEALPEDSEEAMDEEAAAALAAAQEDEEDNEWEDRYGPADGFYDTPLGDLAKRNSDMRPSLDLEAEQDAGGISIQRDGTSPAGVYPGDLSARSSHAFATRGDDSTMAPGRLPGEESAASARTPSAARQETRVSGVVTESLATSPHSADAKATPGRSPAALAASGTSGAFSPAAGATVSPLAGVPRAQPPAADDAPGCHDAQPSQGSVALSVGADDVVSSFPSAAARVAKAQANALHASGRSTPTTPMSRAASRGPEAWEGERAPPAVPAEALDAPGAVSREGSTRLGEDQPAAGGLRLEGVRTAAASLEAERSPLSSHRLEKSKSNA